MKARRCGNERQEGVRRREAGGKEEGRKELIFIAPKMHWLILSARCPSTIFFTRVILFLVQLSDWKDPFDGF